MPPSRVASLYNRFPELRERLPTIGLGERPSPVRPLPGLSDGTAPVWMKDDGAFGSGGWGGNKIRKLEWILPDVHRRGSPTILTFGGLGTNWGYAVALYGREHGQRVALALVDQPLDDRVRAQLARLQRSGATLHFLHTKRGLIAALPWLLVRHSTGRRMPYLLPAGGSSPLGALGYVDAAFELAAQVEAGTMPEPTHVVTAVGSGGTAAGLALGLRLAGLRTRVVGIVVSDLLRLDAQAITRLARRSARLLHRRGAVLPDLSLAEGDVTITPQWLGRGYGHPTQESEDARRLAAEREKFQLDPVYTAKAMAALLAMNASGDFGDGPVLYLHTDGPRDTEPTDSPADSAAKPR